VPPIPPPAVTPKEWACACPSVPYPGAANAARILRQQARAAPIGPSRREWPPIFPPFDPHGASAFAQIPGPFGAPLGPSRSFFADLSARQSAPDFNPRAHDPRTGDAEELDPKTLAWLTLRKIDEGPGGPATAAAIRAHTAKRRAVLDALDALADERAGREEMRGLPGVSLDDLEVSPAAQAHAPTTAGAKFSLEDLIDEGAEGRGE